jgi:hypothetical protein
MKYFLLKSSKLQWRSKASNQSKKKEKIKKKLPHYRSLKKLCKGKINKPFA